MTVLLALLVLAISVRQDQTPLRNGCDAGAETIANLPAGAEVTIRFALSGDAMPCYKIAAMVGGKELTGYVAGKRAPGPGCIRSRSARGRLGRREPSDERGASGDDCVSSAGTAGKPPALAEQGGGAARIRPARKSAATDRARGPQGQGSRFAGIGGRRRLARRRLGQGLGVLATVPRSPAESGARKPVPACPEGEYQRSELGAPVRSPHRIAL